MLLTCLRAEGAEFRDELMAGKYNRQRWDDALSRIDATAFESLIADYFRGKGYRVEHVGAAASGRRYDGGIDLKLYRDGEYVLVQCKHWNAFQVPHNAVHELLGIVMTERASSAILVSSGEFTEAAKTAAAKSGRVQLIDGAALRILLEPAQILPNFVAAQRSAVARRAPVGSWQGVLGRLRSYVRMAKLAGGVLSRQCSRKPMARNSAAQLAARHKSGSRCRVSCRACEQTTTWRYAATKCNS